jgi:phosphoribosylformylglycinamidine synthase
MSVLHLYRVPDVSATRRATLLRLARQHLGNRIEAVDTELCFNILATTPLAGHDHEALRWLLAETFEPEGFGSASFLDADAGVVLEVGPRLSFTTAWSTNAVAVCHACGLTSIQRIERSRRYLLRGAPTLDPGDRDRFLASVHDHMTECPYPTPLESFDSGVTPQPIATIPLMAGGREALAQVNRDMGLAFDDWDLDHYTGLFRDRLRRDPTTAELFDIAQSNSEHSRHWFFKGRLVIDGDELPENLLAIVQATLEANPNNSVIAFRDNSSAIRGPRVQVLAPDHPGEPSALTPVVRDEHLIFTAETHNFPSGVAPFPGAETGTGGRIRDVQATGRGALVVAGAAGYAVGNLRIPGAHQPWEDPHFGYPTNLASPLEIEIEASNGASDYGNKFGEPVVTGFTRTFGLRLPDGTRREWLKPIMFSSGIGTMDARHTTKEAPAAGMLVVKVGGPAYRIGMGGGAASSMVQGENADELDFNAVQRGDAEMEQKLDRVIRACVELGDHNPIVSIHDQGAGGNCNVLKELVEPEGARIEIRDVPVGDATLSVVEIWGAEYQENNALLLRSESAALFEALCTREKVPWAVVGRVTGDGRIVVSDRRDDTTPVDLALEDVLGDMPRKTFHLDRTRPRLEPLTLPPGLTVRSALERVLRLPAVGSKRFLTTKVDRAVTGQVARQQCCGPLQLPVADVGVIAHSHFETTGGATAIGEQPIKGLLDPAAMARLTVAEALTNLVWARVSALGDVRCSANWMWAAKLPGEGAAMVDAAIAMRDVMVALGIAVDGGKDSLSMAALAPHREGGDTPDEVVKAPGTLVISAYVTCPDIRQTVTPDLELPGRGRLVLVDLGAGRCRLGGSALAQAWGQIGDRSPDLDDPALLSRAFGAIQLLLSEGRIAAGHDRSDGGLVTTLLEMAFAGDTGFSVDIPAAPDTDPLAVLFCEEPGLVFEVDDEDLASSLEVLRQAEVPATVIGRTLEGKEIHLAVAGREVLHDEVGDLRDLWEATSFQLERRQADPECVAAEETGLRLRQAPAWRLAFDPETTTSPARFTTDARPRVAILREEGSNSDRELAAAFHLAGFEPWDVAMTDLLAGRVALDDRFRGVAAVGGFSYADVLDSAKGWAGTIRFNSDLRRQFETFRDRPDTFTLGVCNGCQLLALLGWVPWVGLADTAQPRFVHNRSGRFESRFATVRIEPSPSIMLHGMEGSVLGIWLQHGEGRAVFPDPAVLDRVEAEGLAPIRYADDNGHMTEAYPHNPNGSVRGIAALTSSDGRHLAIMPHPERTTLTWNWPWRPREWRHHETSPWLRMFHNARSWCDHGRG